MRQINRALRQVRAVVPAVALTAALLAGGAVTAPPAFADAAPLTLAVQPPAGVGAAGGPVESTTPAAPAPEPADDVTSAPAAPTATASPKADAPVPAADGGVHADDLVNAAPAPAGQLATTGADGDRTGLLAGATALLAGAGVATFALIRRRRAN
ncbi:hypothetical protein F7Q99_08965 [Streptomyces kaniharaensis]|uniref:Gram-positive cocci surface proteins LPxTG domain-containing protein n=1 Tax=Streptomyces kaniharaensis TaxID=212423 RepID=A0A6N7KS09_9ACTN|nr:hypothetical protein [Streptomyces kaniharaensis]MQS12413.1 hypothetical protein [Streptomyces kaniharaensis]